jgi:predicted enzyme related to lactoylglutathione lyase
MFPLALAISAGQSTQLEHVMANALTWFEIPTLDLDRAVRFYETVLGVRLKREIFGGVPHALFPAGQTDAGGALIHDGRRKPSTDGTLIYLDAGGKLDACVERLKGAGGTVLLPKTDIGDPGFIAVFRDSEGNSVALHSPRNA